MEPRYSTWDGGELTNVFFLSLFKYSNISFERVTERESKKEIFHLVHSKWL